jgi:hypothetical protein
VLDRSVATLRLARLLPVGLGRLTLSLLDQAAFGLSTFLVTADVSRTNGSTGFPYFMILWTVSWACCSLGTELLVTPLRIKLPRGELSRIVVVDVQHLTFMAASFITISAVMAIGLGQDAATQILTVLAIVLSGLTFILRRTVLYIDGAIAASALNSALNLVATILLLALVHVLHQPTVRWGGVVAAIALLLPLIVSVRPRWPLTWRIGMLLLGLSKSGIWFATSTALRGLVYSSGLLAIVAHEYGLRAADALGRIFVLASPVQLASSALPLLLFPSLVRAYALDCQLFQRTLRRQLGLCLSCAAIGLTALYVNFDWWHRLLIRGPDATTVGYLPVASCVMGMLLSSWLGAALQVVRPAPFSLATTVAAAIPTLIAVATHIPAPYLASVPYVFAILSQAALIIGGSRTVADSPGVSENSQAMIAQ